MLNLQPIDGEIRLEAGKAIIMPANTIVALELIKTQ